MFDLTGSFEVEGAEAVVRYRGLNTAQEPLLVAHLPSDAGYGIYPDAAYCSLSPDGQHVKLILGDSPFPDDIDVEFGVGAFFKKVSQGEQLTGELRLAIPVQEWNGYFPPSKSLKAELVSVRQVVLHVDVVPQSAVRWIRPARAASDHWSVAGPFTRCSLEFILSVPLLVAKRSDNFPRP